MGAAIVLGSLISLLATQSAAQAMYSKNSPVLQVDARSYDKLIAKSNYTSIIEFYAPWCGHCKNLKPAYEKAASSLAGYAKVAAINCDEDSNKPFCGSMGVQGFPTLKIVKPKKAGGKPIVEDYNGARTAKAINEVLTDKIPNHVTRLKDADLDAWLVKTERPKVIFFTDKGLVSPMVKALAIDFLGSIDVAQVRSSEKQAAEKFMVNNFPQAYLVPGVDHTPERYDGELKKGPLKEFFSKYATPNPEFPVAQPKPKPSAGKKDAAQQPKPSAKAKSGGEEASCPAGHKGKNPHTPPSEKKHEEASTPESPSSETASESAPPNASPVVATAQPAPGLESLANEQALDKSCLNPKLGTCVLAVLSASADDDATALAGLTEIAHKHAIRRSKLFPFFSVPSTNSAAQALLSKLGAKNTGDARALVLAINTKKGWWSQYSDTGLGAEAIETWIDNIRFGDFKKQKLPEDIGQEAAGKSAKTGANKDSKDRDEL